MRKSYILIVCFLSVTLGKLQAQCNPPTAFDYLDINNVKARINLTDMWWDLVNNSAYVVPKDSGVSSLFAGCLWIGGIDPGGELKIAAQTYRQSGNDFFPGPLDASGNITSDLCNNFDRIWKVNRSTIDSFNYGLFQDIPPSILDWPGRSNPNLTFLPDQDLAPFFDVNGDGIYDPSSGDFPSVLGDQALWYVFNDKGNIHSASDGGQLSVEVKASAFSYKSSCLNNTTFYQYSIRNVGNDLDSVFIGLWTDPDLGCYSDDYIGCDTLRNLGIVYNGSADDGGNDCSVNYGNHSPYLGIRVLDIIGADPIPQKLMTNFMAFYNDFSTDGNPQDAEDYYGYLKSVWTDGTHLTLGGNGYGGTIPTNFIYPGDPSIATDWTECSENNPYSDKRFIISSGPFAFPSGEEIKITYAAVWVRPPAGTYPCPSFQMLQDTADCVLDQYQSLHPTGLNELPTDAISVYPNPATDRIDFPNVILNGTTLSIRNVFGEVVMRKTISPVSSYFDISNLDAGIYFIDISSPAKRFVAKFVKD